MLEITNIGKSFGQTQVLSNVSLNIPRGEIFTLLGASGCGKTTLLRMIAGLEQPDSGLISFDGVVWASDRGSLVSPQNRNIGLVFQSYAIWPHLSVFEQVTYPLKARRTPRSEIRDRAMAALESVGMAAYAERPAQQLSGGQQQRVAMARALVYEPPLLLLDEPFSNLDVALRDQLRLELRQIQQRLSITIVLVTHDQADAFALSDHIAVLRHGVVEQVGTPEEIYMNPQTEYVRGFVGRSERLSGTKHDDAHVAIAPGIYIPADGETLAAIDEGASISMLVRPQDVRLEAASAAAREQNTISGTIKDRLFLGDHVECIVELAGGQSIVAYQQPSQPVENDVLVHFLRQPPVYRA